MDIAKVTNWVESNRNYPKFCKCPFPKSVTLINYRGHIPDLIKCKCAEVNDSKQIGGMLHQEEEFFQDSILIENCEWKWHTIPSKNRRSGCLRPVIEKGGRDTEGINREENAYLSVNAKDITFHPTYSSGTCIIRGEKPLEPGMIHYWEIRVNTALTGTDVMFGIGTDKVDLSKFRFHFVSALGCDAESWGLSYNGRIQHKNILRAYAKRFSQGCLVGVYFDRSKGYLEYFLNRQSMGIAFRNIPVDPQVKIYPMVCSTAARSCLSLINACSVPDDLQLKAFLSLLNTRPHMIGLMNKELPGLRSLIAKYWFIIAICPTLRKLNCSERLCKLSDHPNAVDPLAANMEQDLKIETMKDIRKKQAEQRLRRKQKFRPTLEYIADISFASLPRKVPIPSIQSPR